MAKQKILVTGGAGYIGSHTCKALIAQGFEVIVYDDLSTGFIEALPKDALFIKGDILDTETLVDTIDKHKITNIIHFAAKLLVEESVKYPSKYYETNVGGALSICNAMRRTGAHNLVFSSTAAVYAQPRTVHQLISEDHPTVPISPYGKSKLASEKIFLDFAKSSHTNLVILRYFNVAGADINNQNGLRSTYATHLVKLGCQAALNINKDINVFGTDYPTPDGTCLRDYVHVQDLADIHCEAIKYLLKNECIDIFNCGYGKGFSVLEVLSELQKISKNKFNINYTKRRDGDAVSLIANSERLTKKLNWKPKYNNLQLICQTALEWEKKFFNNKN